MKLPENSNGEYKGSEKSIKGSVRKKNEKQDEED